MKTKITLFFVLSFLLWLIFTTAIEAKLLDGPAAKNILLTEVQKLLYQEKYDELEKMANEFRTTKAQFIGGGWKLAYFYSVIDLSATNKNDVECSEYLHKLAKWMQKYPDSITPKIATSNAWLTYAWRARGNDYANTVTEQGWKLMRERVEKAYELVKDKPLKPSGDCPGRYYILIKIAGVQGWDRQKYEALFREAVSFEPWFHAYYIEKAAYLMPRWGGKEGEWQRFAAEAVKLTPKSEGMGIYTRILRIMWEYREFKDFNDTSVSWVKMKQGFLDMERVYPNSLYNLNYFCMFACIAEDKETARNLFNKIGNTPYAEVWKGRANFEKWRKWASAKY